MLEKLKLKIKNMKPIRKVILLIFMFFYVGISLISIIRINYSLTTPGAITKATTFVEVKEEGKTYDSGMVYGTSVFTYDRITIMKYLIALTSQKSKITEFIKEEELTSTEDSLAGKIYMETSSTDAIIAAFTEASKINNEIKVSYSFSGMVVTYVNHKHSKSDLQVGDIITSLAGKSLESVEDYKAIKAADAVNMQWDAVILRDGKEINMKLDIYQEGESYYRSFSCVAKHVIDTENTTPKFEIKESGVSGPSAGLMQALSIYNSLLEEDVTKGKVIAGTGTINILKDGTNEAGKIGSIEQKIYTVDLIKNLDYFFVDQGDYDAALETYSKLESPSFELVSVSSLTDIINFLKEVKDGE